MTALTRPGDRTHSACLSLRYTDPCSLCAIHRLQTRQPDHPTSSATASSARTCSAPNPSSRSGFGRSSIGFQHPHRRTCSVSVPSLTLPGNSSACPAVAVSSRQKSTAGTNRAHGKTHSPSARYVPARTPAFATLPMLSLIVASCHIIAMSRGLSQGGVRLALTVFRSGANIPPRCPRDRINVHK
jgi:hypothetical protein